MTDIFTCRTCGQNRPEEDFRDFRNSYGVFRNTQCRSCENVSRRERARKAMVPGKSKNARASMEEDFERTRYLNSILKKLKPKPLEKNETTPRVYL